MIRLARAAHEKARAQRSRSDRGEKGEESPRDILKDLFSAEYDPTPPEILPSSAGKRKTSDSFDMSALEHLKHSSASDTFWKHANEQAAPRGGLFGFLEKRFPEQMESFYKSPTMGSRLGWGGASAALGAATGGLPGAALGAMKGFAAPEYDAALSAALKPVGRAAASGAKAVGQFAKQRVWDQAPGAMHGLFGPMASSMGELHSQLRQSPGLFPLLGLAGQGLGVAGDVKRIMSGTERFRPMS